ncbi:MAG: transglycosylase domain-containing protein [Elusimicrobia bacterium]|nr:transglycosylase domain-containing protein [Elusimicrobiota bacterium]
MRRSTFYLLAVLAASCIAGGAVAGRNVLSGLPPFEVLERYQPALSTHIYDDEDRSIAELSIERRKLLTLSEIPVDLQNAVLATEDARFFKHWGLSPRGILRAAVTDILAGRKVQGGSTLTQQLAKIIFLSPRRTFKRKLREAALALQLEHNLSKEEILQLYLNQIYYGEGAYGAQSAASIYFGKDIKKLDLAECALLAGLPNRPSGYSPFRNAKAAGKRRAVVLSRMRSECFITEGEEKAALAEPIPTTPPATSATQAPYFVEYVRRRLEPRFGYDTLWRGGLSVHTTLDLPMQQAAEEEMEKALSAFDVQARADWARRLKEDQDAGIDPPSVSTTPPADIQGVFVALDARTGAVKVMIGGRGDQFNRAVQAQRQPGSTFKPFVWAAAIDGGMTASTLVDDTPLAYYYDGRDWRLLQGTTDQYAVDLATAVFANADDFRVWVPSDYDNKFLGVLTLRTALALSRNVTSVRLIDHVGPPKVVELAHRLGIQSHLSPVLSLGLGSSVVSPLEMASAFQTFANGGIHVQPYSVSRVEDSHGKLLDRHIPQETEALSPQTAYVITNLLENVVQHGTGMRARELNRPLAGKTGTTNDNKDLWFVGYTPDLVGVAWMGYDDATSLGKRLASGTTLVPWWTAVMKRLLADEPVRDFPVPDGIAFEKVDAQTGYLALPTCPEKAIVAYKKGTEPTRYCPFDHSQPLQTQLKADFAPGGQAPAPAVETSTAAAPAEEDGAEPDDGQPPLPSDQDLQNIDPGT